MNIGIIDADLIGRNNHRFPNLACMKLSGYYKSKNNNNVTLITNYENISEYDLVFISKVFTDTVIPNEILKLSNVKYGGTGFFFDKAHPLSYEIEHHFPDYDLYNDFVNSKIKTGKKRNEFEYYLDYSIGFTTRGCFRKCAFCINKNYNKVSLHSPINEFLDNSRKYICLLDDNVLGYSDWKNIIIELKDTNKYFQYKQGMDERLMTEEKADILSNCKYKGDYIFAFDNIEDAELIKNKLKIWKKHCKKTTKLYVLCGFDRDNKYDDEFWKQDIIDTFERIKILIELKCLPYIMRFNKYEESPYRGMYVNLARWCNQPNFLKKKSYREFCYTNGEDSACYKYLLKFEKDYEYISKQYFDIKWDK